VKKLSIIGLGLIGGSISAALKGFEDYTIYGMDIDPDALAYAREHHMADVITDSVEEAITDADVVICCLHPQGILDFFQQYGEKLRPGTLLTDVGGVKSAIMEGAKCLPDWVDFIGGHPMAGRERGGIQNSTRRLFWGAHYIITPRPDSRQENIDLLKRIAEYLGCRDTVSASPKKHDDIIAYTSQIMHVMAVAICDDPHMFDCSGFVGGSFRDVTRIAALEPDLWTELFSMNAESLTATIQRLEDNLKSYREAIAAGERDVLMKKLQHSSDRKRRMNLEHQRGDDIHALIN